MPQNFKSFIDSFLQIPCCEIGTVAIDILDERERMFFSTFMPKAKNAIVLGHHVTKKSEWRWYATNADALYAWRSAIKNGDISI